jgi:hypothetical protein
MPFCEFTASRRKNNYLLRDLLLLLLLSLLLLLLSSFNFGCIAQGIKTLKANY